MVYIILVAVVLILLVYFSQKTQNKSDYTEGNSANSSDSESELLKIAMKGVDFMEQNKSTSTSKDRFNILVFNTLYLLMIAQNRDISNYKKVEEEGMDGLLNFSLKNQIFKKSYQAKDYINTKNLIFHKEIGNLSNSAYIPSVIYDAFYENSQSDIIQATLWKGHLVSMIDKIGAEFDATFI